MNGPISLFVVIFGSILNGLTIYFLFFYAVSKRLTTTSNRSTIRSTITTGPTTRRLINKPCLNSINSINSNLNTDQLQQQQKERLSTIKINATLNKYSLINNKTSPLIDERSLLEKQQIPTMSRSVSSYSNYSQTNFVDERSGLTSDKLSKSPSSETISTTKQNNETVGSFILATLKLTTQNSMLNRSEINYLAAKKSSIAAQKKLRPIRTTINIGGQTSARPRVYTFFLWLVISDTTLLLCALLMYSIPALFDGDIGQHYVYFTPFFYLASNTALTASVWLMCALIFDRYRTIIVHPFVKKYNNNSYENKQTKRIHQSLLLVYILALCFSLPRFFELRLQWDPLSDEYYLTQTSVVRNKIYMIGYRILGGLFLYSLFPYVVLFVLSFRVRN